MIYNDMCVFVPIIIYGSTELLCWRSLGLVSNDGLHVLAGTIPIVLHIEERGNMLNLLMAKRYHMRQEEITG
ncbi:hypothetical protein PR048_001401 [Dryococelus australis]|uniref:Uncharacterized protein n=1 Tax=Dryococelus australis TaxID=614101 RepID=A0ABQ9IH98_9NEOP|nr:hypothetical protein PR048_001401 [Dryococelus australis]